MEDRPQTLEQLHRLAGRIEELGHRLRRLHEENRSLRMQQDELLAERAILQAKNEQARERVEGMIARLRSLEQHT